MGCNSNGLAVSWNRDNTHGIGISMFLGTSVGHGGVDMALQQPYHNELHVVG